MTNRERVSMKSILIGTAKTDRLITLANLLQRKGYVVIPAADADGALLLLRQGVTVDAVIADYDISDLPELIRAVRSREPLSPPVIAISDRVAVSDYLAALSLGAFDLVFWPVRPAELVRIVHFAVTQNKGDCCEAGHQGTVLMTGNSHRAASFPSPAR
jgi:DNA-binding response OmpR family regulator